jgi:DNA-binding response OmpR family regulator
LLTKPLNILIVEDDADAGETLVELLNALGHRVRHFATGQAALLALASEPSDVALLDLGLPDVDGFALANLIRSQQPNICLVAFTGYDDDGTRAIALGSGFDAFLVKPLSLQILVEALAQLPQRAP